MKTDKRKLGAFARALSGKMYLEGRYATARHYVSSVARLLQYLGVQEIPLQRLNTATIEGFNAHLRAKGLRPNTVSFYNRNLRALLNRAKPGWGTALFAKCFTGNDSTLKRAIPVEALRSLRNQTKLKAGECLARDLFLFSFYACGIPFVDLVYLKKENLKDGHLIYTRRKTGRQIIVKVTPAMQEILARYAPQSRGYLFPFLDDKLSALQNYGRYCSALTQYNRRLKRLSLSLTSYVARHTWASVAYREVGSPISVIGTVLGHGSERTTRIYLAGLDQRKVDVLQAEVQKILTDEPKKKKNLPLGKRQTTSGKVIDYQRKKQAFLD
jgi:integrase